jgi:hypothetical protein
VGVIIHPSIGLGGIYGRCQATYVTWLSPGVLLSVSGVQPKVTPCPGPGGQRDDRSSLTWQSVRVRVPSGQVYLMGAAMCQEGAGVHGGYQIRRERPQLT